MMSAKLSVLSIALAAVTMLPMTQASAQGIYVNSAPSFEARLQVAENRIDNIRARGIISQEQYDHLMDRVSRIRDKESRVAQHGGLTPRQQAELMADLQGLDSEMAYLGIADRQVATTRVIARPLARVYKRTTIVRHRVIR
jgi:hypothetical protein